MTNFGLFHFTVWNEMNDFSVAIQSRALQLQLIANCHSTVLCTRKTSIRVTILFLFQYVCLFKCDDNASILQSHLISAEWIIIYLFCVCNHHFWLFLLQHIRFSHKMIVVNELVRIHQLPPTSFNDQPTAINEIKWMIVFYGFVSFNGFVFMSMCTFQDDSNNNDNDNLD